MLRASLRSCLRMTAGPTLALPGPARTLHARLRRLGTAAVQVECRADVVGEVVALLIGREVSGAHVRRERTQPRDTGGLQVCIAADELRDDAVLEAEHVVEHEHLTV